MNTPKPPSQEPAKPPADTSGVGLRCRECGCAHFFVVMTRPYSNGRIMRRRECRNCGKRVTTYERTSG